MFQLTTFRSPTTAPARCAVPRSRSPATTAIASAKISRIPLLCDGLLRLLNRAGKKRSGSVNRVAAGRGLFT
ncbi:hypothetical protein [Streptomyces sp. NPDC093594]|uniref:hypothetical protein n=1 Tax=Streptomyces sp. NPDC093594 TaxID=3155305 RepID=UPI00344FF86D